MGHIYGRRWRVEADSPGHWAIYDGAILIAVALTFGHAERIVEDHARAEDEKPDRLKLETLAGIARSIRSDADKLEAALMGRSSAGRERRR